MAWVGTADGGDLRSMPRGGEPVMDGSPDAAALHGRLSRSAMAGDQQDEALSPGGGLLEAAIDCGPGRVEVHAVQVNDAVGLN